MKGKQVQVIYGSSYMGGSFKTELTYPKSSICLSPSAFPPIIGSVLPVFSATFLSIALGSLSEEKEDMAYRQRCLNQLTYSCTNKLAELVFTIYR